MRVLLVKTSSMGDVIHTLPALTDAQRAIPGIRFDWVVEEGFADIPAWHPAVERILPVAIRRWRKTLWQTWRSGEYRRFKASLREQSYDLILDAQGLTKSAWLTRGLAAPVHGLDKQSAREGFAQRFYDQTHSVSWELHAVERLRTLFASALGYEKPTTTGDYGLDRNALAAKLDNPPTQPWLMFLHGTTWPSKHWPEANWRALAEHYSAAGWQVRLPWGNAEEQARAQRIADGLTGVEVLPKLRISEVASWLAGAHACVAVDTGLGHLAAAMDTPCVSLYGPTLPGKIGAYGAAQVHLCASGPNAGLGDKQLPCFDSLGPNQVIAALDPLLASTAAE